MSLDAARQREKEAEKAAIARKRRKAAMEREYNRSTKTAIKDKSVLSETYASETLTRHQCLEEEHGIGNLHYGWARHRKQRMQPVTDASQLFFLQLYISVPTTAFGRRCFNDYQTLKDGTMLARASSKIKLTRATMVSSLKKIIVAEVSSSMLHTVLRTNNGSMMSFGVVALWTTWTW